MRDREDWQATLRERLLAEGGGDPAHDLAHVERVVSGAVEIGLEEGADLDVLLPAAWLHDCVQVAKDSEDRSRASLMAADRALALLEDLGYPTRHLAGVHHAIVAHSFSAGVQPETVEAKALQDADRLDALGAIGLSRCLMLGGHMGTSLASPVDPFCHERKPDDGRFVVDHFFTKLLKLGDSMNTQAGRRLAARRTDFLRRYLDELKDDLRR